MTGVKKGVHLLWKKVEWLQITPLSSKIFHFSTIVPRFSASAKRKIGGKRRKSGLSV
jgi:hypothetical protein